VSSFAQGIDKMADEVGLSWQDRLLLKAHWPLFRAHYEARYSSGLRRRAARSVARLVRGYSIAVTVRGPAASMRVPVAFADSDLASFTEVFVHGEYEIALGAASTYVDLGANTGMAAYYFAARFPLTRMLLVEANPALMPTLARATASLGSRAEAVNVAVASSDGTVHFIVDDNHRYSRVGGGGVEVPSRTLRGLLDERGLRQVDLLKVDIEGAEHGMLAEDPEILERCGCLVMEVHGSRAERDRTISIVRTSGFRDVDHRRELPVDMIFALR
jgi:FkbM family methyltransferase